MHQSGTLRRLVCCITILMACIFSFFTVASQESEATVTESKLANVLDEIYRYEKSVSPLFASRQGDRRFDDKLPDLSAEALEAQFEQRKIFKSQLLSLSDTALSRTSQINKLMQLYALDDAISQYQYKNYLVPLTSEYGFHSAVASLPKLADTQTEQGLKNYLSRLKALPTLFQQNIDWMKEGIRLGMTQPKAVMLGFEESVQAYITPVEESVFYQPFNNLPAHLNDATKKRLQNEAKRIVEKEVFSAYQGFYDFLVESYIPASMETVGAINWPNGKGFYQDRAKHYTTTDMSVDAIHNLGLREVARIKSAMQAIIDELEFKGEFADFIHFLRTDPQFYASSPKELLVFASYVAKRMDAKLPSLFHTLPSTPYGVAPVPDAIAPKYTTGRYISPPNDREPGYYWVNTYALDKRPLYAIPALTLHEAVPGHHLQIMLANENTGLPPIRKTYISAFGEGWGLYSEFLGIEAGIYETPYEHFGRLSYEMWRACRLVVDTGMHMKGWTRQQGINYMLENTALSEHNVRTEIDRYISWPAQALSYKIGEIRIKTLRQKAENQLRDKFDIREFHFAVLEHGSVPLYILEENVDRYIEEKQL